MSKRMVDQFMDMVKIDSESGNEAEFMQYLLKAIPEAGGTASLDDYGNLIAKFDAKGCENVDPILLSCHADTVLPGKGIEPIIEDGVIKSKGDTILGADDKAGIAEVLEAMRTAEVMPPVEVRIASAAFMPATSSGEVSCLTKMTLLPFFLHFSASSAVNTT